VTAVSARPVRLCLALVLVGLSLVSCARVSRWLLVGTWVMVGGTETIEFREDGTLRTTTPQGSFDGRWETLGARSMRVTVRVVVPEPPQDSKTPQARAGKSVAKAAKARTAEPEAAGKTAEPVVVRFRVNLRTLQVTWPNGARSSYYRPR